MPDYTAALFFFLFLFLINLDAIHSNSVIDRKREGGGGGGGVLSQRRSIKLFAQSVTEFISVGSYHRARNNHIKLCLHISRQPHLFCY